MAKGRPPLNPRIEALEKHISHLDQQLFELKAVVMQHDKFLMDIFKKLDTASASAAPYKPLFDHWPGLR